MGRNKPGRRVGSLRTVPQQVGARRAAVRFEKGDSCVFKRWSFAGREGREIGLREAVAPGDRAPDPGLLLSHPRPSHHPVGPL